MKKKIFKVADFAALQTKIKAVKKQLRNNLSDDAADLRDALEDMLDELANSEVDIDEEALAEKVTELIRAYNGKADEEVPAAVANAIAAKVKELQNTMPKSEKLTPAIKNQVAAAILRSHGKNEIKDAVQAVLVKNGISGLSFEESVDYAIADNWGNSNRLFAALRKTPFSKFYYTSQDVDASGVKAHGWDKTSETAKQIQAITANGKTISTQYVYKRQQIAQEDLDDMREVGGESEFLRWLNEELDRQIVNTIVGLMLGSVTEASITTIEALKGTGATDAFRTAVSVSGHDATDLTIEDIRALADAVSNPNGKAKWLVIDQTTLTQISKFVYASGGDTTFHRIDDLKGMLGVDDIYVTSLATTPIVFLPDGYWVKEKNALSVTYPNWEFNAQNYQKERNIGSGVHDLKSVAFPKYAN